MHYDGGGGDYHTCAEFAESKGIFRSSTDDVPPNVPQKSSATPISLARAIMTRLTDLAEIRAAVDYGASDARSPSSLSGSALTGGMAFCHFGDPVSP